MLTLCVYVCVRAGWKQPADRTESRPAGRSAAGPGGAAQTGVPGGPDPPAGPEGGAGGLGHAAACPTTPGGAIQPAGLPDRVHANTGSLLSPPLIHPLSPPAPPELRPPPSDPLQNGDRRVAIHPASGRRHHGNHPHQPGGDHHCVAASACGRCQQEDGGRWQEGENAGQDCSGGWHASAEHATADAGHAGRADHQHQRGPGTGRPSHHHQRRG